MKIVNNTGMKICLLFGVKKEEEPIGIVHLKNNKSTKLTQDLIKAFDTISIVKDIG